MVNFYDEIKSNKQKSYLLVSFFIVLIVFLCYVLGALFFNAAAGIVIGVFFAILFPLIGYYSGDSLILQVQGARVATKKEYPYLVNTVEGLAIASQLPVPKVYVIQDTAINAFATGRDPQHAIMGVTTGALEKLKRVELEGVLAHEMSHIRNYDIRFMMLVVVLVGFVTLLSDFFIRSFFFSSGRDRNEKQSNMIFLAVALILAILTPVIAQLVKLAVSRKREYLADASGAQLTRYPQGLADALKRIRDDKDPYVDIANKATAHLWISNPLHGSKKFFDGMFSTHPDINSRIKNLEEM